MMNTLLTPVRILSEPRLDGVGLATILRFTTKTTDRPLSVAVVVDRFPIERRSRLLGELGQQVDVTILDQVSPNPMTSDIDSMYRQIGQSPFDAVVGIGGGSVLDSAKALAMLMQNGGSLEEYLGNTPNRTIGSKGLPLILIPTTAGTGSEVTKVGVYTSSTGRKFTLGSPLLLADVAILCGVLTESMPPALTAAVGFDALDHALESIWNRNATPITREAAVIAARMVLRQLEEAYAASGRLDAPLPGDSQIRQSLLEAACAAGIAFSMTGTAAGHALSFILSENWHIPHGSACAFTLIEIFHHALSDSMVRETLAQVAAPFFPGEHAPEALCTLLLDWIVRMKETMGLPETFNSLGVEIQPQDVEKSFERAFSDPKMANQIPGMTPSEVFAMLKAKI